MGLKETESLRMPLDVDHHDQRVMVKIMQKVFDNFPETTIGIAGLYFLSMATGGVAGIKGDIVEVGTYRGRSASVILETNKLLVPVFGIEKKHIYLFDTFTGVPIDETGYLGEFSAPQDVVSEALKQYEGQFTICPGIFPEETGQTLEGKTVSLAHIDVDTGEFTIKALNKIYPLMSVGGVFLIHDFSTMETIRTEVLFFCRQHQIPCFEIGDGYAMIIKSMED